VRVFVAGATGAIGRRLVPLLVEAGHEVTGLTRSPGRVGALSQQGAEGVVGDALDAAALREAVAQARPEVIVSELTDIPQQLNPRHYERQMAGNDRLRVEGTHNLLAAAEGARVVAQSISFAVRPVPHRPTTEEDPLWLDAPAPFRRSVQAVASLEEQVTGAGGVVLRYGYFYGPGTSYGADAAIAGLVRRRRFPIVGGGTAVWSFIHVDDAARATVAALDPQLAAGVYNVVDDDPAPVRDWLPAYAQALGAPEPRRAPAWLARVAAGSFAVTTMTKAQGASNAKARRALDWGPRLASWRLGFRTAL
jgi:nucleoside-diphosphate-sugar epimerase